MKASLLAVAVLATIAISSAVDEECVQRKLRGLVMHWPNPIDCGSFFRCTNKSVKRHILCPAGKEYNPKSGRCGPMGKNLCKLSLRVALDEALNPCSNVLSGTYVADAKSCRNFNICNNNLAYPQSCDAGSYFNTIDAACIPDPESKCWENLCLNKENGLYMANENDCYSFYICSNNVAVAQECPSGSYFDKTSSNCRPGVCPADVTTTTATITSTEYPDDSTTASTTCTTTSAITTTTCVTAETTSTSKIEDSTTTPCDDDITTPQVTTPCDDDTTTQQVTTPCDDNTTTPETTDEECPKINCDQAKCVNASDLDIFPALNGNNKVFCICISNEAVCRECPEGSEFLPSVGACFPAQATTSANDDSTTCDTTTPTVEDNTSSPSSGESTTPKLTTPCDDESHSKCGIDLCDNADDDSSFPLANTNTAYCVCFDKKPEYRECAEGTVYNSALGICTSDTETPTPVKCKGDIAEGDFVPNPNNCMLFYICFNGELIESSCGTGNYYNETTKSCTLDTEGKCSDCANDQPAKLRSKRSVTITQSDNDDCCTGGHQNGDVIPHPTDCDKKLVCCNGELKEESCGKGFYFNSTLNECVEDVNNVCGPATPSECVEGQVEEHPSNCSMYLECCHGVLIEKSCDQGYCFKPSEKICVKDTNNNCCSNDTTTCEGGFQEGHLVPNPSNCSSYFHCSNGELKTQYCGYGFYYSIAKYSCVEDVNNICWPEKTPTCSGGMKEGDKVENPSDCASYLFCSNGQVKKVLCGNNMIYDKNKGDCKPDTTNSCWPKRPICEGGIEEGGKAQNPADCASYLMCSNGELKNISCGYGMIYNSTLALCKADTNNICWPKEPTCEGGVEEGHKVPHPSNCSFYYICCHGDLQEEFCGKGMIFNSTLSQCVSDDKHECWTKDPTCQEGDRVTNPDDCCSYLECTNGELEKISCSKGMIYNNTTCECESDTEHICWPKEPTCEGGVEEGHKVPHPSNCSFYYICCHGDLQEEFCGKGMIFNSTLSQCVSDDKHECWTKDPTCQEGDRVTNPDDCCSYLECTNGELEKISCSKGMIYNNTTCECESDTEHICWPKEPTCEGGVEEGHKVPHPSNCSFYYICCHGDLQEEFCGKGMIFNSTLSQCVSDDKHECWAKDPTCQEGDRVKNPDDCCSYLECTNGELEKISCGNGMIYNNTTCECESDTEHICWPKEPTCEGGVEEGHKVPHPSNCSFYYICCHGDLQEEFCGKGMIFNSTLSQCVSDDKHECWAKDPTCQEGDRVTNPDDCCSYLECTNGELEKISCGNGMIYNNTTCECESDTEHICWPKEPTCEGGVEEGKKIPNRGNCSFYYICCHGILTEEFCGKGMLFDEDEEMCKPDNHNICWANSTPTCDGDIKEGDKLENIDNCASYFVCCNGELKEQFCETGKLFDNITKQCRKDESHTCWPKETCDEGQQIQNPNNCSSYFRCCDGKFELKLCDEGFYFNPGLKKCSLDVNNTCTSCTCEGKTLPVEDECDKMLVCKNGQWQVESCGKGFLFDKITMKCEKDTKHVCWPQEVCTCSGGYEEGDTSPAADCAKYYTCSGGIQVLGECGINMYYNATCGTCEPDTEHKCWPNYCADQPNGAMVENPKQCNAFYLCNDGESTDGVCETGYRFDPKQSSCQPDVDAVCYNPCACQDKIKMLPHLDCPKFYFCNGNQTIVETCPAGGFDTTIGDCNPEKKCSDNECEGKPDYVTYADVQDKTKFYVCLKGVPVLKSCLANTEYNGVVCAHVSSPDCDPTPCSSEEYLTPYSTLNGTETNAFCICRRGYASKQYCAADYVFSTEKEACYSDAPCNPLMCRFATEYTVFMNDHDDKSFCLCTNNKAVIVPCPNNETFNAALLACSNINISTQCDQYECVNRQDYYTYPDSTGSTEGFCMCKDHVGIFENCAEDSTFNITMGVCQLNNIQCNSSKCVGLADNTKIPALISSQGYCECVNDKATYYNCKNNGEFDEASQECKDPLCDPIKCEKADDFTLFPAVGSSHGFCMCLRQEVVYKPCDEGGVFNTAMLVCQMPLKNCVDSMCAGVANNAKLPADYSIYGYCSCTDDKATFQKCPNGQVFDPTTQSCETENLPIQDVCDTTYCDDPGHAGQKYPSFSNIYGYCECSPAGPSYQPCPNGEIFNSTLMSCRPTANSQCDLSLCFDATPNNGYPIPTKTGNTSFCYCTGPGNAMLINCPNDLYYNDNQKKCVATIEEGCSCPGGLQSGDVAPDPYDYCQYYMCISGSMHQQSCSSGQYFNTDCNKCEDDITGVCVKKEACSCLGTYREGERLVHPYNEQMYYVCENKILHERDCGTGRIFNQAINQCMRAPRTHVHHLQKRSVDSDEVYCHEEEKRSVPSNCSQYEICRNQTWISYSCPPFNYYNPEQRQCVEPLDDTVCAYAKVTNLPTCDEAMERQLYKSRTCQQYFRCEKGKWHLNNCGKHQYYNARVASCLSHHLGEKFKCSDLGNNTEMAHSPDTCQDLSMRPYAQNCAMYLMCAGNQWWYNYCPLGMYFNRTLNYCLPDEENVCPLSAINSSPIMNAITEELPEESCQQEELLRPSAVACNRYYICIGGQWKQQNCGNHNYYDAQLNQCSADAKGICQQLKADCLPEDTRILPANCSAYERCSVGGKWTRWDCPQSEIYDDLLHQCIANDGICSNGGLRKVCSLQDTRKMAKNCTQFYYCNEGQWAVDSCLGGSMYWPEKQKCVPHSREDKCKPLEGSQKQHPVGDANETNPCADQLDGMFIPNLLDCTRYYICVNKTPSHEMQCPSKSFFDTSLGYCRPNDGSCRLRLWGVCENATEDSMVAHTTDCQSYYFCSSVNGQQLMHCPEGQYFHNYTHQCRVDHGECKTTSDPDSSLPAKCSNKTHGTRLAHETLCNTYYVCVKDLAVPTECPDNYQFNASLRECIYDQDHMCQNGKLVVHNLTTCENFADGSYIADRQDCTRYYICSARQAQPKKCSANTFFDDKQLLCVPDNGSCPFVDKNVPSKYPMPPNPIVCEGKHGNLMPDPVNCNNFYVCVNGKLRHDRCYPQFFFNTTLNQCQQKSMLNDTMATEKERGLEMEMEGQTPKEATSKFKAIQNHECSHNSTSTEIICGEFGKSATIAEQGDCRFYITCEEDGAAVSQRCRNGESYDSLLGFCRQNDGTCQMDSGQRAGECSDRHGQLARDTNDCRKYFICINGQKIAQSCAEDEYFSKSQNLCIKDTLNTCVPQPGAAEQIALQPQSCNGLNESTLYPYIHDNCRSYFQCVKGVVKVQQCADSLYFDPSTVKCIQNRTECVMPSKSVQRSPIFAKQNYEKLCSQRDMGQTYGNIENNCRSFYTCHPDGEVSHELCPLGMAFDKNHDTCMAEEEVICN